MATGYDALAKATHVIITFGTAYVFEHAGRVVCNCHKLPAGQFTRRRLDIEEITDIWRRIIDYYPDKKFIFTVSPIRHTADGLHGNQLSKATLHLAIDSLGAEYFPAYEALVDDLRDYRFYADDLVHPSPMAVSHQLISRRRHRRKRQYAIKHISAPHTGLFTQSDRISVFQPAADREIWQHELHPSEYDETEMKQSDKSGTNAYDTVPRS
jgi:hypothetical protein